MIALNVCKIFFIQSESWESRGLPSGLDSRLTREATYTLKSREKFYW